MLCRAARRGGGSRSGLLTAAPAELSDATGLLFDGPSEQEFGASASGRRRRLPARLAKRLAGPRSSPKASLAALFPRGASEAQVSPRPRKLALLASQAESLSSRPVQWVALLCARGGRDGTLL